MSEVLTNISNISIPLFLFYIIAYGILMKSNVYDDFIVGAKRGVEIVFQIVPTLVGLMVAVGILRASGFFEFLQRICSVLTDRINVPSEIVPLIIVRMFSASAATGIVTDLFRTYGTDSFIGFLSSVMMSSTETIFYTMSVYFMSVKISKTRWTLPGALICTLAGIIASIIITKLVL